MKKQFQKSKTLMLSAALLFSSVSVLQGCGQPSSEEHILNARQHIDAKDTKAAILSYKSAIQADPQSAQARFELGRLYIETGEFEGAEKELDRALELGHSPTEILPLLSVAYQQTGARNALAEVDHTTEGLTAVEATKIGFYKLQAMIQLDQVSEARALLDDLRQLDTQNVYKGLVLSVEEILNGNYDKALADTLSLRKQAPMNKDVLQQLARLYLFLSQPDAAVDVYKDYVELYPDDTTTRFTLAALLMEQKRLKDAEPYVDGLLALSPSHGLLNQYKGFVLAADEKFEDALNHFNIAVQNGRNDGALRLAAGFSAYQLADYVGAASHLSMVANDLPANHPGLRMLADSLLKEGQSQEASSVLARMDGDSDFDAGLFSAASYQLLRQGNVADARALVTKSSSLSNTAADLTKLGILQLSLNDVSGIVNLEEAVKKAPESVTTQQTLARAYLLTGEYEKAFEVAEQWHQANPETHEPLVLMAEVALNQQQADVAADALAKAEAIAPNDDSVQIGKASVAIYHRDYDTAKSIVDGVIANDSTNTTALSVRYAIEKQQGNGAESLALIKSTLDANPNDILVRVLAGRVFLMEQEYAEVLSILAPVEPSITTPKSYWDSKGQALLRTNQLQEAIDHYESWLTLYPNDKAAVLGMLLIYDVQGKQDTALTLLKTTQEKRPDTQFAILEAYFLALKRKIREAEVILAKLSATDKALPFVRGIRARLQLFTDKAPQAVPNALAAYEATPNSRNMLLVVACYEVAGQTEEAFQFLSAYVERFPSEAQGQMLLAERLISRDADQAKVAYEKTLELVPNNFIVLNNLAYLYLQSQELDKAEDLAEQAVAIRPDNADAMDTLAQVLVAKEDYEEALELYDRVISEEVRNEEVYLNYIEVLLKMDRVRLAQRRLEDKQFTQPGSLERLAQMKETYKL